MSFKAMHRILISNCSLSSFKQFVSATMESSLWVLDYSFNQISALESGHFTDLTALQVMNLSSNFISVINVSAQSTGLFSNLVQLSEIQLGGNLLTTDNLKTINFNLLVNLEKLNLTANRIVYVTNYLFYKLEKLTDLDLSYNQLRSIESNSFHSLTGLKNVHLSYQYGEFVIEREFLNNSRLKSTQNFYALGQETIIQANFDTIVHTLKPLYANRTVHFLDYYHSINVVTKTEFSNYTENFQECFLTIRFLKHMIHYNLDTNLNYDNFLRNCKKTDFLNVV
jgi:hypothetical protein